MSDKVMLNSYWNEKVVLLDHFECRLFTWGILTTCDFWGVIPNNTFELSRCVHQDSGMDTDKIIPALTNMEQLGLISFIGDSNQLIIVENYGDYQHYSKLRLNFVQHNKRPKYEREMKQAIRNGELEPFILELPHIVPKDKVNFKKDYLNKQLSEKHIGVLLYPKIYEWYCNSDNQEQIQVINSSNQETKPKPIPVIDKVSNNTLSNNTDDKEKEREPNDELPF